jgi:hypothetical protein
VLPIRAATGRRWECDHYLPSLILALMPIEGEG